MIYDNQQKSTAILGRQLPKNNSVRIDGYFIRDQLPQVNRANLQQQKYRTKMTADIFVHLVHDPVSSNREPLINIEIIGDTGSRIINVGRFRLKSGNVSNNVRWIDPDPVLLRIASRKDMQLPEYLSLVILPSAIKLIPSLTKKIKLSISKDQSNSNDITAIEQTPARSKPTVKTLTTRKREKIRKRVKAYMGANGKTTLTFGGARQ